MKLQHNEAEISLLNATLVVEVTAAPAGNTAIALHVGRVVEGNFWLI